MKTIVSKKYYEEINIVRGLALLAVLLGHSFPDAQTGMTNLIAVYLHSMVYSFHMGVFFFVSGFVSGNKLCGGNSSLKTEIIRKVKRIMVPYLFYSLITFVLKQLFAVFANNPFRIEELWKILIGINPNGGLWFLWTLFVISVGYLFWSKLTSSAMHYLMVGIALLVISFYVPFSFLDSVMKYSIYYSVGILVQQNYNHIKEKLEKNSALVLFLILMTALLAMVYIGHFPYFLTCLSATVCLLICGIRISNASEGILFKVLSELGNYSFDIYLISYFVQVGIRVVFYRIWQLPYWAVVIMMFFGGAVIPYCLCRYIIRKIPICNKIMLGNWNG